MNEPWYKASFGPEYLEIYPHRGDSEADTQLPVIASLLDLSPGAVVLDLACGTGRHTLRLRDREVRCFGLDLSKALLDRARQMMSDDALLDTPTPPFVRGDMRFLPFASERFDAVINVFTSFGYFDDTTENRLVLEQIQRILKPGGRALIDYLNPDRVVATLVPRSERTIGDLQILEERRFDPDRGRVEKTIVMTRNASTGPPETTRFHESVALFSLRQMRQFIDDVGMTVTRVLGDFDGSDFGENSPRMILMARRDP